MIVEDPDNLGYTAYVDELYEECRNCAGTGYVYMLDALGGSWDPCFTCWTSGLMPHSCSGATDK